MFNKALVSTTTYKGKNKQVIGLPVEALHPQVPCSATCWRISPPPAGMSASLSLSGYAAVADSQARRRKLSQAVANRLIVWRSSQTQQLIVEQAKSLCGKYLRAKLRNCALLHKKLGLQRLKSVSHLPSSTPWSSAEVALELRELGLEMERTHPELFQSVIENVGLYSLPSEGGVQNLLHALAVELFREGHVTWGRIVALYAMAGALAVDCVKLGHPEFVLGLVQVVGNCVERDLGNWIIQQGGWASLLTRFKKTPTLQRSGLFLSSIMIVLFFVIFYYLIP
ncbi:bcl-2-related ovarian killer protein homolog A [Caerostris darwini]|uniref:Bcl-2-related ovarian killer protein homolog A n=1 Tax=Caerostris darwini TaxID=1538125 RepID=A0AAV4U059_9ARAC|nr:bcl-2-related ovarian killer protein homolog A [Caerostris darwini]